MNTASLKDQHLIELNFISRVKVIEVQNISGESFNVVDARFVSQIRIVRKENNFLCCLLELKAAVENFIIARLYWDYLPLNTFNRALAVYERIFVLKALINESDGSSSELGNIV